MNTVNEEYEWNEGSYEKERSDMHKSEWKIGNNILKSSQMVNLLK